MKSTTNTLNSLVLSIDSTTKKQFQAHDVPRDPHTPRRIRAAKSIENAVYAHIRAIRALGRTTINTNDIAAALSLPVAEVNHAISSLKRKGVRALNG